MNEVFMRSEESDSKLPILENITGKMPGGFFIYRADDKEELLYAFCLIFLVVIRSMNLKS